MAFFKSFNKRWSLYLVKDGRSAYAMHGNTVMQIIGYVIDYFAKGKKPVDPWDLYLVTRGQKILLGPEHFTLDGQNVTPLLTKQLEALDPRWSYFKAGDVWCEDAQTKKEIKISERTPGDYDIQKTLDNINKPREVTFFSVMNEVFGRNTHAAK